jgi:hypothetical protein
MRTVLGIVGLGLIGFGCGKDTGSDSGDLTEYGAMIAVFEESCGAGCHTDGSNSGGLDLDAAVAAGNLVDMPSQGDSTWTRVVCGDADASALYTKLFDPAPFEDPMPLGNSASADDIAIIKAWIEGEECGG